MNNLAEVYPVGLGVGGNYVRCRVTLYHLYLLCKLFLRQYLRFGLMQTYIIFQYVR